MKNLKKTVALAWVFLTVAGFAQAEPVDAAGWLVQGNQLYAQKDYDGALTSYAKSLRLDNRSAAAYQGVGNSYLSKGDKAKASKYYNYSLSLAPNNAALRNFVAKLTTGGGSTGGDPYQAANQLSRERRYDEAIPLYQQAIDSNPQNAKAHQGMGNAYYAKGDRPQALARYRKSLQIEPNNVALANFLSSIEKSQGGTSVAQAGGGGWAQPAWRSALVPGWGQVYNGQTGKGLVLGVLTYGMLAGEVVTYMAGTNARNQYLSADSAAFDYNGTYNTWESMAGMNHIFYFGMVAAYTYTLVDAIWNAGPKAGLATMDSPVKVAFDDKGVMVKTRLLQF